MRDYHHVGKYGKTAQGRPVRAKRAGNCHLCKNDYRSGELLIYLPGSTFAVHPYCVFGEVEVRSIG